MGVLVSVTNVVVTLILGIAIAALALTSIGFLLSSFFLGRKAFVVGLIAIVPFLSAYGTSTAIRSLRQSKADEIKAQLEDYHRKRGQYPADLSHATTITIKGLRYIPSASRTGYYIEYLMDGFNRRFYNSETKEWGTLGWND